MSEVGSTRTGSEAGKVGTNGQGQPPRQSIPSFVKKHWQLLVILLLVVALGGMYAWKTASVNEARAELRQKAERVIMEQNMAALHLVSIPLVWAVRSEMISGNYDQINQYLINFVKEPHVDEVVLVKPDGAIVLATNKKLEGTSVADSFPETVLQVDKTTVSSLEKRGLMAASPIMGLNKKLGVLIVVYVPAENLL